MKTTIKLALVGLVSLALCNCMTVVDPIPPVTTEATTTTTTAATDPYTGSTTYKKTTTTAY